jgi:hypothetical protein
MNKFRLTPRAVSRAMLALSLLALPKTFAQVTDNFDSGSMGAGWNLTSLNPALVSTTFVDSNGGKAVRLRANPFPAASAPAVGGWYRSEVLTDFYVAFDLVDWPGTDKDQAFVIQGRGQNVGPSPANGSSVILNYDTSQEGEDPTDRREGQLQINLVNPGFDTDTLAAAAVTLQPGRSYRFVFKGEGSRYTGMVYDWQDFTKPLVTVVADDVLQALDSGFAPRTSGQVGILGFSRNGVVGTVDLTFDNFYAAATGNNLAAGTALSHPVPGTPVVTERTPSERFKNFFDRSGNISFTAKTHNENVINAAATKLWLNGVDVSSALTLSANGSTITGSYPGSALTANTVYSATIEVFDAAGTKTSKNTFWFDTFTDAFVSSEPVKAVEAEDYNRVGGEFLAEPIPVSGMNTLGVVINGATGYYDPTGANAAFQTIDIFDNRTGPETPMATDYRGGDRTTTSAGVYPEIEDFVEPTSSPVRRSDNIRGKYASQNLLEYIVRSTEADEWMNYTRTFADHSYKAYLRVGSFGATAAELHEVTGNITLADQTTTKIGTFNIPNFLQRYNFHYVPLVDDQGMPVTFSLSGLKTVRLWMKGTAGQDNFKTALNYVLFVPQIAVTVTVHSSTNPQSGYTAFANATIDANAKTVTIPIVAAESRYFILNGNVSTRISSTAIVNGNLVLTYE